MLSIYFKAKSIERKRSFNNRIVSIVCQSCKVDLKSVVYRCMSAMLKKVCKRCRLISSESKLPILDRRVVVSNTFYC